MQDTVSIDSVNAQSLGDLETNQLIEAGARVLLDSGPGSRVYTAAKLGNATEQTEFRIGEVAMRAGVTVDALRYYERVKLSPHAKRSSGGFCLFGFYWNDASHD
jgi:hypothetical protein